MCLREIWWKKTDGTEDKVKTRNGRVNKNGMNTTLSTSTPMSTTMELYVTSPCILNLDQFQTILHAYNHLNHILPWFVFPPCSVSPSSFYFIDRYIDLINKYTYSCFLHLFFNSLKSMLQYILHFYTYPFLNTKPHSGILNIQFQELHLHR